MKQRKCHCLKIVKRKKATSTIEFFFRADKHMDPGRATKHALSVGEKSNLVALRGTINAPLEPLDG